MAQVQDYESRSWPPRRKSGVRLGCFFDAFRTLRERTEELRRGIGISLSEKLVIRRVRILDANVRLVVVDVKQILVLAAGWIFYEKTKPS